VEEIEVPIDKIQEDLQHEAAHSRDRLLSFGAVLSAILATFAAIASLSAGHHSNEALIEQILASNSWSHYQAKGIKASVLQLRADTAKGQSAEETQKKLSEYKDEQQEISKTAKEHEDASVFHLNVHQTHAFSVTFFQVAIAMTAIAVLVKKRALMLFSGAFSLVGLFFLIKGFLVLH
jgi:hypothetical protein